jgi:translation initiation factor eIF-2B subunit delta
MVEVGEECGVPRSRLTLRRAGAPLDVEDAPAGLRFRVHPFLFSIDDASQVRSDWEASRFEWVEVDELQRRRPQPAVPKLYEAFEAVWPPWPAEQAVQANLDMAVRWLRNDRRMGSGELARAAAREALKLIGLGAEQAFAALRSHVVRAADQLGVVRPTMTPLANLLQDVRSALEQSESADEAVGAVEQLVRRSEQAEHEVAIRAAQALGQQCRVMTISYSSTVLRTLLAAGPKVERVYVCEGRPLLEGRRLATELSEAGLEVTLLTDAQAFAWMPRIDVVLLGADSILPSGDVVNKAGSAQLALAARHFGKPVMVAAETLKLVRGGEARALAMECNPAGEVWPDAPAGVEVANVYFEAAPAELIGTVVTEAGPLGA